MRRGVELISIFSLKQEPKRRVWWNTRSTKPGSRCDFRSRQT